MVKKSRSVYLDILRILAVLLVIFTHTGGIGAKMYTVEHVYVNKVSKILALGLDVFRCVNVPLFFMISGALLLRRTLSYKDLLFKRLLKYIMIVVAISYFYSVFYLNNGWIDFGLFFRSIYNSPIVFHLWFLYSYLGYLFMLPLIKRMTEGMQRTDYIYFLILGIIFKGALNVFGALTGLGDFGV